MWLLLCCVLVSKHKRENKNAIFGAGFEEIITATFAAHATFQILVDADDQEPDVERSTEFVGFQMSTETVGATLKTQIEAFPGEIWDGVFSGTLKEVEDRLLVALLHKSKFTGWREVLVSMANHSLFNHHADFQTAVLLSESTTNANPEDLEKAAKQAQCMEASKSLSKLVKAGPGATRCREKELCSNLIASGTTAFTTKHRIRSLLSVRGARFTQTAVQTKPRLKTDLTSTHPPATKPRQATCSCGSSLDKDARSPPPSSFTRTCQLTVEEHAFHVGSCVRFWSMSSAPPLP